MPLMPMNPVVGLDNFVDSVVVATDNFLLKKHNTFIMNNDNPFTKIQYGFDTLQIMNANGEFEMSESFMFNLALEFIKDEEEFKDKTHMIQYHADTDQMGVNTIYVSFINWIVGANSVVNVATEKKKLIDCGNGVSLFIEFRIFATAKESFVVDVFLWAKVVDKNLLKQSLSNDNEEQPVEETTEEESDNDEEPNTGARIIQFPKTYGRPEFEESDSVLNDGNDGKNPNDEDDNYNLD